MKPSRISGTGPCGQVRLQVVQPRFDLPHHVVTVNVELTEDPTVILGSSRTRSALEEEGSMQRRPRLTVHSRFHRRRFKLMVLHATRVVLNRFLSLQRRLFDSSHTWAMTTQITEPWRSSWMLLLTSYSARTELLQWRGSARLQPRPGRPAAV